MAKQLKKDKQNIALQNSAKYSITKLGKKVGFQHKMLLRLIFPESGKNKICLPFEPCFEMWPSFGP